MKKLALSVVVAGVFLAGCGDNLPKEITSHENYKNCQEVEKNLLTIQSSFEKDERVEFFTECTQYFDKMYLEGLNKEQILKFKDYAKNNFGEYKFTSINDLAIRFSKNLMFKAQENNRDNTNYVSK